MGGCARFSTLGQHGGPAAQSRGELDVHTPLRLRREGRSAFRSAPDPPPLRATDKEAERIVAAVGRPGAELGLIAQDLSCRTRRPDSGFAGADDKDRSVRVQLHARRLHMQGVPMQSHAPGETKRGGLASRCGDAQEDGIVLDQKAWDDQVGPLFLRLQRLQIAVQDIDSGHRTLAELMHCDRAR